METGHPSTRVVETGLYSVLHCSFVLFLDEYRCVGYSITDVEINVLSKHICGCADLRFFCLQSDRS